MNWLRERKIAWLKGTKRTADVVLAQTLEKFKAGHVKSVYVGIQWDDGTFSGDWSSMPRHDMAMHLVTMQQEAREEVGLG